MFLLFVLNFLPVTGWPDYFLYIWDVSILKQIDVEKQLQSSFFHMNICACSASNLEGAA